MALNFRVEKANRANIWSNGVYSLVFALTIGLAPEALASDFAHAQKVYVPPSNVDRRIDFSSIREQYTLPDGTKKNESKADSTGKSTAKAGSKTASKGKLTGGKATAANHSAVKTASGKPMVKTVLAAPKIPAAPLHTQTAPAKSISELAKSLSEKMPPSVVAKLKAQANEMIKSGKLEEAQRLLTKVGQMTPEDKANLMQLASVGVQRAKVYLKSNNFQGALLQARTALSANPHDAEASQILGELYRRVGADPNDVSNRLKTANTLFQQGRYAEAEVEYKASLAIKATPEAHVGIGKVFEKLNGPGRASKILRVLLSLIPIQA